MISTEVTAIIERNTQQMNELKLMIDNPANSSEEVRAYLRKSVQKLIEEFESKLMELEQGEIV